MTRGKLTLEQALGIDELPKRPKLVPKNAKSIILNGQEFPSLAAACRFHKLVFGTVNDRIKGGWSIKQAFGLEPPPIKSPSRRKEIKVGEKTFITIKEACNHYNISETMVRKRISDGWDILKAFTTPKQRG